MLVFELMTHHTLKHKKIYSSQIVTLIVHSIKVSNYLKSDYFFCQHFLILLVSSERNNWTGI